MKREEIENHINFQLTLASIAYYNENHTKDISLDEAFEDGAEWMQKMMIDKACEWIKEHIDIPYEGGYVDDSPIASDYIEWCEKRLEYAEAVADAFKQAMED